MTARAHAAPSTVAADGLARSVSGLAEDANAHTRKWSAGLIEAGALLEPDLPEFAPLPLPMPDFAAPGSTPSRRARPTRDRGDVRRGHFAVALLDGVTGSGKTETYFEAVAEALRQERQSLILLPEIALTVQFLDRFAERFGVVPAEWHSDLSRRSAGASIARCCRARPASWSAPARRCSCRSGARPDDRR